MKKNKTKELIEITIKSLSNEISMRNVKNHLLLALNELNKIVEKKENNKINNDQKWKFNLQSSSLINMSLPNYKNALSNIEQLIAKEENKINKSNDKNDVKNLLHD